MIARFGPALFFVAALVGMIALALGAELNHDEHQFIASAALVAREGLLPYRDFPYFHTPNLVGIYALLFQLTDHLLLAARLFSTVCAWLSGLVLFAFALRRGSSIAFALGVAALFLANPVVAYTFPKAWNNLPPTLLLLLAFVSQCRGAETGRAGWFFASGFFVAFAAGTRISFAPLALPFLVMAGFTPLRFRAVAMGIAGMSIASIPAFYFLAITPGEFLFDNLVYNSRINSLYRLASGDERSALAAKIVFIGKTLVNPGNLALLALGLYALWHGAKRWRSDHAVGLLLAIIPFALLGVLAPAPSYTQYFAVLAALLCLAIATTGDKHPAWLLAVAVVMRVVIAFVQNFKILTRFASRPRTLHVHPAWLLAAAATVSLTASIIQNFDVLTRFASRQWDPIQLHAEGLAVRENSGPGRILTLAPIVALEGGCEIYGAFSTGSFAWRTAPYLSADDRRSHGFIAPPDLPALLAAQPPVGILLGYDKKRETALLEYAESHQYRRIKLPDKINLWVPPTSIRH